MFCARVVYWDRLGAVPSSTTLRSEPKWRLLVKWEVTATMTDDLKTSECDVTSFFWMLKDVKYRCFFSRENSTDDKFE